MGSIYTTKNGEHSLEIGDDDGKIIQLFKDLPSEYSINSTNSVGVLSFLCDDAPNAMVEKIVITKKFSSASKPLLLRLCYSPPHPERCVILKYNEDIRKVLLFF